MVRSLIKKVIQKLSAGSKKPAEKPSVEFKSQPAPKAKPDVYQPSGKPRTDKPSDQAPSQGHGHSHGSSDKGPQGERGERNERHERYDRSDRGPRHGQSHGYGHGQGHGQDQGPRGGDRRRRPPRRDRPPRDEGGEPMSHEPETITARPDLHEGWNLASYDVPVESGKTRFIDLNVNDRILHAVADLQFQYCTPIQAQVLPFTLVGRDAFGQAQTGTGKTAAFMIAILDHFLRHPVQGERQVGRPRALVIAPTRELVIQIHKDAVSLSKYMNIECAAVFGGMDYEKQQRQLQNKAIDIVCATPGRLLDFKRRGDLNLTGVEILVLDEADRMLDMGFIPDVREIIHSTPPKHKRQTMLFSATMTDDIRRMAEQWTKDPVTITIAPENVAVDTVEQIIYIVTLNERFALTRHLITQPDVERAIIFVNRRTDAEKLTNLLDRYAINCDLLSGAVPQNRRVKTLEQFREGRIKVLVATDVAGRGLHVDNVSHVLNFSMPEDPEDYVHRIGRTGRAGKSGISISFATEDDAYQIPKIEEYIGRALPCTHPDPAWLELPEPPVGHKPHPRHFEEPPRHGGGGGRGGPRGGGGRRPPRRH